jgi:hypothetical protein
VTEEDAMVRFAAVSLTLVSVLTFEIQAGVIPGRWEKVETIPRGLPIVVILTGGDRMEGTFQRADHRSVQIETSRGVALSFPKDGISLIRSQDKFDNDGLANGVIIGAVAGAGASIPLFLIAVDDNATGAGLIEMAFVTGTGMAIGMGIDALIKAPAVFYRAPE